MENNKFMQYYEQTAMASIVEIPLRYKYNRSKVRLFLRVLRVMN